MIIDFFGFIKKIPGSVVPFGNLNISVNLAEFPGQSALDLTKISSYFASMKFWKLLPLVLLLLLLTTSAANAAEYIDYGYYGLLDNLDPRLPQYRLNLLSRLQVSTGFYHSYYFNTGDYQPASELNSQIAEYLRKKESLVFAFQAKNVDAHLGFMAKEDWLGMTENDDNISNLQSSFTFRGTARIADKIELCQDITIFRADSTYNLEHASTTGEFLKDPRLNYNFPYRGALTSDAYFIEVQTDRALIKASVFGVDLSSGRERLQYKIGYRNGLIMSGIARPVDMFYRIDYHVWRVYYSALAGQLTDDGKRYISLKRLAFRIAHNLQIGGTEGVMYYDDPTAYINPLMFFYLVHRHRPTNQDNLIATFDISYTPFKTLNLYGVFLDDDYIMFEGGASKYGYLVGLYKTELLSQRLDFRFEYTNVRKWTYTHVSHVNAWEYRNVPFGFWLGPDADELYSKIDYYLSPSTCLSLNFDRVRKGEGVLDVPWEDDPTQDKKPPFPSGVVEKSTGGWLDIYRELGRFSLRGRVGYRFVKNAHNEPGELDNYFLHLVVNLYL